MAKSVSELVQDALSRVKEITPEDAKSMIEGGGYTVIDVRESEEVAGGMIPGAIHIPRGFLEVKADLSHPKREPKLEDRSQPIILYCAGGVRSALAADTLQAMGFENVASMAEGWGGWASRGFPVEK